MHVCALTMWLPGAGGELLCGCWDLNLSSLQEQPVLLTAEPSFQLFLPWILRCDLSVPLELAVWARLAGCGAWGDLPSSAFLMLGLQMRAVIPGSEDLNSDPHACTY